MGNLILILLITLFSVSIIVLEMIRVDWKFNVYRPLELYRPPEPYKVFDCFMASTGEEDLVLLRILFTNEYVDKYVIMDSDSSHKGHKKELLDFGKILPFLSPEVRSKIVYENVQFPTELNVNVIGDYDNPKAWRREEYQRSRIWEHLKELGNNEDLLYVSDLDEIPYYKRILGPRGQSWCNNFNIVVQHFELPTYTFNIHWRMKNYKPCYAYITSIGNIKKLLKKYPITSPPELRENNINNLRTGGIRKAGTLKRSRAYNYTHSAPISYGKTFHLNRFSKPKGLKQKHSYMVESGSVGTVQGISLELNEEEIRKYFKDVCEGRWEDLEYIENPDIPSLVYEVLHPIHTMNIQQLRELNKKVESLSKDEVEKFSKKFFE